MTSDQRGLLAAVSLANERSVQRMSTRSTDCADPRIKRALIVIAKHYNNSAFNFSDLSKEINLSPSGFRHLFTKTIGMSPHKYRRILRLNHASQLLVSSFLSVKQIASAVGYSDASRFGKDFSAQHYLSPKEYRKRFDVNPKVRATAAQG
jgi:AraC family transcriptional regulator, arabinose operon regulatory protein